MTMPVSSTTGPTRFRTNCCTGITTSGQEISCANLRQSGSWSPGTAASLIRCWLQPWSSLRCRNQRDIVPAWAFLGADRCSTCKSTVKPEGPNALLHQVQAAIGRGLASYRVLKRPAKNGGMREYHRRVDDPILFELKALADLAARHREEFEGLVAANMSEHTFTGAG